MKDEEKTKEQLIKELAEMRQRVAELEAAEAQRNQAEEALQESKQLLERTFASLRDAVFIIDADTVEIMDCNPAASEIFGYSREEMLGQTTAFLHVDQATLEEFRQRLYPAVEEKGFLFLPEFRMKCRDGTVFPTEHSVMPLQDEGGKRIGWVSVVRDITKRKQVEEALAQERNLLRALMDNVPDYIYFKDRESRFIRTTRAHAKMFGLSDPAEAIGKTDFDFFSDKHAHQAYEDEQEIIRTGQPLLNIEERETWPDWPDTWVLTSKMPLRDEEGKIVGTFGISKDITERKRAEEALLQSEARFRSFMQNFPGLAYMKDSDGRVVFVNEGFSHYLGLNPADMPGKTNYDLFPAEFAEKITLDDRQVLASGGHEAIEEVFGGRTWATYKFSIPQPGALPLLGGLTIDITERKRAEEAVRRHLERIEALLEVDRAIISTLELTGVLDIILEELERVIPYHSAGIYLLSGDTAKLAAGRGFPDLERVLQVSFPVKKDPLTCELLQEKRPLILADAQADKRFLARGGTEYVRSWIGVPLIARGRVVGFLTVDHKEPGVYGEESAEMAQAFASQVAIAIENARLYEEAERELAERKRAQEELRQSYLKLQKTLEGTVRVLVSTIEMRDPYTAGHQRRATQLACAIAKEMDLTEEQMEEIRIAGLIHDLGKINVPAEILSKPGRLTDLEFGLIKMHPQIGHDVLKTIEFPWPVAQIVLQHHERMDGSGYPQGLSGEEIMLEARILAVADVVEAMSSHRPYRPAHAMKEALEEISQNRGILYDPEVVDACLKLFTEKGVKFK